MSMTFTDDRDVQQSFHIKVEPLADGRFRAVASGVGGVEPVTAHTRQTAISRLNGLLQDGHRAGTLVRKELPR
jgi:hypothetical protein